MADLKDLAILTAEDLNKIDQKIAAKADKQHVHTAEEITAGTLNAARLPAATTGARGGVMLATTAQAQAGSDGTRAVTPQGVHARVSPLEQRLAVVEGAQGTGGGLANTIISEGVPTANAPVGYWAIDATTGDFYRME